MTGLYESQNPLVIRGALELLANLAGTETVHHKIATGSLVSLDVIYAQGGFSGNCEIVYPLVTILANLAGLDNVREFLKSKGARQFLEDLAKKHSINQEIAERILFIQTKIASQ